MAKEEGLRFSVAPGVLGLLAQSGRHDQGYKYTLEGDLQTMASQKAYLARNGFNVGQCGVYPALKTEEEFARALALIWENKAAGWWLYERHYIKYEICTKEEFWAALRPHPTFFLGDKVDWNLGKMLEGLASDNPCVVSVAEISLSVVRQLGHGPFRVSQVRNAEWAEVYRPYFQLLLIRKDAFGVWLAYDRRLHRWVDEAALKIPGNEEMHSWPAHLFRKV